MGKGNDFWLDDPEWEALRRKAENRPTPKKPKYKTSGSKHQQQKAPARRPPETRPVPAPAKRESVEKEVVVSLKFRVPKPRLPDFKYFYATHKRQATRAGGLVVAVIVIFGAFKLTAGKAGDGSDTKPTTPEAQAERDFNPLIPLKGLTDTSGKKIAQPDYKFDEQKKVLGYNSEYNEAKIVVSQQGIPDQLKTNPGQLEGIARSVSATVPIDTQKGRAYIATNDDTGDQTVIFATKDVLVFIRSNKELDKDDWKFYINQLTPKE